MFVLDEADIMIDSKEGLGKTIQEINRALPRGCQKLLFSATFEPAMRKFAEKFVGQPCHAVYEKNINIDRLKQYWIQAGERPEEKQNVLKTIYDTMKLQVRGVRGYEPVRAS
jgi:ATP-dependent RNA helicase DDX19/DBP5